MAPVFVPDDYLVPLHLAGPGFRLEPLGHKLRRDQDRARPAKGRLTLEEEAEMIIDKSRRDALKLLATSAVGAALPLASLRPAFAADKRLAMVV